MAEIGRGFWMLVGTVLIGSVSCGDKGQGSDDAGADGAADSDDGGDDGGAGGDGGDGAGTGGEEAQDVDGDGFTDDDCDDTDPAVHPGADERCNGVDDDCDSNIDEDAIDQSTWYPDADGDGFGATDGETTACDAPPDHVSSSSDCDDTDVDVHPAAAESCGDAVDNDCDGAADCEDETCAAEAWCVWCVDGTLGSDLGEEVAEGHNRDADDTFATECGTAGGRDVVLWFLAPGESCYAFDTSEAVYDTVLALAEDCDSDVWTCDDNSGESTQSRLVAHLLADQEVLVIIDGNSSYSEGDWGLAIEDLGEVDVTTEDGLPAATGTPVLEAAFGSRSRQLESSCGSTTGYDLIWEWTAPSTDTYTFDTLGSDFDTVLSVHEATCGLELGCNDDGGGSHGPSVLTVDVEAGVTYLLRVAGYDSGDGGNLSLSIQPGS